MNDCPNAGLCKLMGRHIHGRQYQIWTETVVSGRPLPSRELMGVCRFRWCEESGVPLDAAYAVAPWPGPSPTGDAEAADTIIRRRESVDPHQPESLPCAHRGDKLREEACKPCLHEGRQSVPVYHCARHTECILRGLVYGRNTAGLIGSLPVCLTCPDRKVPVPVPVEPPKPRHPNPRHPLPKHVTRWAVGITSAPRPQSTVARSWASIRAAGFEDVTIYAEPGTNGLPAGAQIVTRPERLGCWRNYVQTLRDLLAAKPDAQAIVVFQDDVVLCRDVREFLEHDLWPSDKTGAVSLYSPDFWGYEHGDKVGFKRVTGKYLMGACAFVYPRHAAEALVSRHAEWRGRAHGVEPNPAKKKATDTWIGHAIAGEQLHVYYPSHSLTQHIAESSSLGHGGASQTRKGRNYRRSGRFTSQSAFTTFAASPPDVRFNANGGVRIRDPLSVVIPAWNCLDLTERCLTALATNADVTPLDVIYVDNGSDPGTVEAVESLGSSLGLSLRTIRFPVNRGFCPAANAGMELAVRGGRHVLLLNNDCYIHRGCLSAMLRHMFNDPQVASVGPLTSDQGSQSINRFPDLKNRMGKRKAIHRTMIAGFCQLKRKSILEQIGYLDENLPHGLGTDDDWCARAMRAGYVNVLALDAFADHDHKSTFRRSGLDRRALQQEAVRYLKAKGVLA